MRNCAVRTENQTHQTVFMSHTIKVYVTFYEKTFKKTNLLNKLTNYTKV